MSSLNTKLLNRGTSVGPASSINTSASHVTSKLSLVPSTGIKNTISPNIQSSLLCQNVSSKVSKTNSTLVKSRTDSLKRLRLIGSEAGTSSNAVSSPLTTSLITSKQVLLDTTATGSNQRITTPLKASSKLLKSNAASSSLSISEVTSRLSPPGANTGLKPELTTAKNALFKNNKSFPESSSLTEECGIVNTIHAKIAKASIAKLRYFRKTKPHNDINNYKYLYREDKKIDKLIGIKDITEAESSSTKSDTRLRPLAIPESHNDNSCKLPKKSSAFALSTTNIIPPSNGDSFSKNEPQQDDNYQIEDGFLMASEEANDKSCINCSCKYGDEMMWLKCYICSFWLHMHCSVFSEKQGAVICPPCSLKQCPMPSVSFSNSDKETSILENKSTFVLISDKNADNIVNNSSNHTLYTFKKKCVSCNKKEHAINLKVCNSCMLLVHSNCCYHQMNSWKCPKCFIEQSCRTECVFCNDLIHKSFGKLFIERSAKLLKWHCRSCNKINKINYDPKFFQDIIYQIDKASYDRESQKYLTKEEEEELVLHILGDFYKKHISISKFQKLVLSFVKSKDGTMNQNRVPCNGDWKWRFIHRHPILKEIVNVKEIYNEEDSFTPTSNPKKQKTEIESSAEHKIKYDNKKLLIRLEKLPLALCETVEGRKLLVSRSLKEQVNECKRSLIKPLHKHKIKCDSKNLLIKLEKLPLDLCEMVEAQKLLAYQGLQKQDNGFKRSLMKSVHKHKIKCDNKKILIKLKKLPLELCQTVEGRKMLVSQCLQKQDDTTIVCVGCETNSGSMNSWLGCDSCISWWHIKCAGLPTTLTKSQIKEMEWHCPTCKKVNEIIQKK